MNDMAVPGQAQDWSKYSFFRCSTYWTTFCFGRMSAVVEPYTSHPAPVYIRRADVEPNDVIRHPRSKGFKPSRKARIRRVACLVAQSG